MKLMCSRLTSLLCLLFLCHQLHAELHFNLNALNLSEEERAQINWDILSRTDAQLPDTYQVDIIINDQFVTKELVKFVLKQERLVPSFTATQLLAIGINTSLIKAETDDFTVSGFNEIESLIPQSHAQLDFDSFRLMLSIPQKYLFHTARGAVDKALWQKGMNVLYTDYAISGYEHRYNSGENYSSQYINLHNGLNLYGWHLRDFSYFYRSSHGEDEWENQRRYVERDIPFINSRLTIGKAFSQGRLFDNFLFKGIMLTDVDQMLPFSQHGYAPVIRGNALTNATVEIRQRGYLIYQTTVSPGPFEIDDLDAISGDVEVTIIEEDGSRRSYIESTASLPVMVRKHQVKYNVMLGEYSPQKGSDEASTRFFQGELLYGVFNYTTLYGGLTIGDDYQAYLFGIGQNLGPLGGLSFDVSFAQATLPKLASPSLSGYAYELRYNKTFSPTGTNLTLSAKQHSTQDYLTFEQFNRYFHNTTREDNFQTKQRLQINLGQQLGEWGFLSLNGYRDTFWDNRSAMENLSLFWSKTYRGIGFNASLSLQRGGFFENDNTLYSLGISLPIGDWLSSRYPASLYTTYNGSNQQRENFTTTLNGSVLEDQKLNYSLSHGYNKQYTETQQNSAIYLRYQMPFIRLEGGYSHYYNQSRNVSWGAYGSAMLHRHGLTFGQDFIGSSALALVKAEGVSGAKIANAPNVRTDWRGYAIVPYLQPYLINDLQIDTKTIEGNADINRSVITLVPTHGAVVLADYEGQTGYRAYLTILYNHQPIPFGTTVVADNGSRGMANEKGEVYMNGLKLTTQLTIELGEGALCQTKLTLEKKDFVESIAIKRVQCHAQAKE